MNKVQRNAFVVNITFDTHNSSAA